MNRVIYKFPYIPFDILFKNKKDRWSTYYMYELSKLCYKKPDKIFFRGIQQSRIDYVFIALHCGCDVNSDLWFSNNALINLALYYQDKQFKIVKLLIERGINVNYQNIALCTPLMAFSACDAPEVIELLLKAGAKPNTQNKVGKTALMFAMQHFQGKTIELLLKYGADPTLKDNTGKTMYDYHRE